MLRRTLKKISIVLILGLTFNSCAKRENDNQSNVKTENIEKKNILDWNGEKIEETIGNENEGIIINAQVYVYNNKMYKGQINKTVPDVEAVENVLFNGEKMVKEKSAYDENDKNNGAQQKYYYAYYEDGNKKATYDNDDVIGLIDYRGYKNYRFNYFDTKATYLDASNMDEVKRENYIMESLNIHAKPFKYFEGIENDKVTKQVEFFNELDGAPILYPRITSIDYTYIQLVESDIVNIEFLYSSEFSEEKEEVTHLISPEELLKIIENEYKNGNLSETYDWIMDRIILGYMETDVETVTPVWIITTNQGYFDEVVFAFDAVTGKIVFDIGRGDNEQ